MVEAQQMDADYQEHLDTYVHFLRAAKYGVGVVVLILIFMAIFLT